MRIYRYIPGGKEYTGLARHLHGQWWPDGIDLGEVMRMLLPKAAPWPHEGNRYVSWSSHFALPDFPAFALNVPVMSERAAAVLTEPGLIAKAVPMTVDGRLFFAIQPQSSDAFRPALSAGLSLPGGEAFHYYKRHFDTASIAGEFFGIRPFLPFTDLYITDRLMERVRAAGLTGLEYSELVWDDGPVEPVYQPVKRAQIPRFSIRRTLEYDLIANRCALWSYDADVVEEAIYGAVEEGRISFEYVQPATRAGSRS